MLLFLTIPMYSPFQVVGSVANGNSTIQTAVPHLDLGIISQFTPYPIFSFLFLTPPPPHYDFTELLKLWQKCSVMYRIIII